MLARANPFRTERLHALDFRFPDEGMDELLKRFVANGLVGAIVGKEGSGKTTLCEQFGERLTGQGYVVRQLKLTREQPRFDSRVFKRFCEGLGARDVVMFDGAELLSWVGWYSFRWHVRHAAGLLITSHHAGRLPTLYEATTSIGLLYRLTYQLIGIETIRLTPLLKALYFHHQGNIREAFRTMYDLFGSYDRAVRSTGKTPSLECYSVPTRRCVSGQEEPWSPGGVRSQSVGPV